VIAWGTSRRYEVTRRALKFFGRTLRQLPTPRTHFEVAVLMSRGAEATVPTRTLRQVGQIAGR
jgi:hypothetical protein